MTLTIETGRRQKVAAAAYRARHHALNMGEAQGQGYIGQALGAADMLASVYTDQLRYRAEDPHWEGRDRFLLSTGHYAIGCTPRWPKPASSLSRSSTPTDPTGPGCRCPEWQATHPAWRSPAAHWATA